MTFLFILFLFQSPKITCTVTGVEKNVVTLACPAPNKLDTVLDVPEDRWPENWMGRHTKGARFPAQWISGHLVPLATSLRLIQEMTREQPDYERNPVN